MTWVYSIIVLHMILGVLCACVAHETRHRAEPWFLAGTLLGGLALIGLLVVNHHRKFFSVS